MIAAQISYLVCVFSEFTLYSLQGKIIQNHFDKRNGMKENLEFRNTMQYAV